MQIAFVVAAVVGGIPYKGDWTIGVLYYVNDTVTYLGVGYICTQENVASARHTPGAAPFFWETR